MPEIFKVDEDGTRWIREEPRSKEGYIRFLRGSMTDISKNVNKDNPERLLLSLASIELLCKELTLR